MKEYWSGEFFNLVQETGKSRSLRFFVDFSRQFRAFDDPLCKTGMDYELPKDKIRNGILQLDEKLGAKIVKGNLLSSDECRELRNAGLSAFRKDPH